jgi:hypothetical protein
MKQQKLPLQLFTSAMAPSAILIGPARTISSTQKPPRQSRIYTDMRSNVDAPLTVKGTYIGYWSWGFGFSHFISA